MFGRKKSTHDALSADLVRLAHKDKSSWAHLLISWSIDDSHSSGSEFFYDADGSWRWADVIQPEGETMGLIRQLREEARESERGPWDGCLIRIRRGASEPDFTFLYGTEAEEWKVSPKTFSTIVEKGRPT